jgi:hypothetical protein
VMSCMTWLTRLSAKAHFSGRQLPNLESGLWESGGEDIVAFDCPKECSVEGVLFWPSSRTMCASKKSAIDRGASCCVEESNPTHWTPASTQRVHAGTLPSHLTSQYMYDEGWKIVSTESLRFRQRAQASTRRRTLVRFWFCIANLERLASIPRRRSCHGADEGRAGGDGY